MRRLFVCVTTLKVEMGEFMLAAGQETNGHRFNARYSPSHSGNITFLVMYYNLPTHRYYNAGERPTTEILHKQPELIHRVKWRFGVHMLMQELYDSMDWPNWQQNQDTIHLLINHRSYLDPHFKE